LAEAHILKQTEYKYWRRDSNLRNEVSSSLHKRIKTLTMRSSILLTAFAASPTLAFPWLTPEGAEALFNHPEARAEIQRRLEGRDAAQPEPRQAGTGLVPGVIDLLGGTVKATLDPVLGLIPIPGSVKGLKKFPEGMLRTRQISTPY
jgi:hypothetical protein